jgi:putative flippase GtrA
VSNADSLAATIEGQKDHPLAWKSVLKRAAMVVIAGLAIYLVLPAITEVLASWPRLSTLDPRWLIAALIAQAAHFTCTFALQRLALRTKAWFP